MRKLISLKNFAILSVFVAVLFLITSFTTISAADGDQELTGYAWSSNVGWISFNCDQSDSDGGSNNCTSSKGGSGNSNYAVTLNNDGTLTGWAWSSNIGWIQFGGFSNEELPPADYGTVRTNARLNSDGDGFEGWARAYEPDKSGISGWDGWISLSGDAITQTTIEDDYFTGNGSYNDLVVSGITYNPQIYLGCGQSYSTAFPGEDVQEACVDQGIFKKVYCPDGYVMTDGRKLNANDDYWDQYLICGSFGDLPPGGGCKNIYTNGAAIECTNENAVPDDYHFLYLSIDGFTPNPLDLDLISTSGYDNTIVQCPVNQVVTSMAVTNYKDNDTIQDMRVVCAEIGNDASLNTSNTFTHTVPDGSNICPVNYAVTKLEATNQLNGDTLQDLEVTCTEIIGTTLNTENTNSGQIGWVNSAQQPTYSCGSNSVLTGLRDVNLKEGEAIQSLELECTSFSSTGSQTTPTITGSYKVTFTDSDDSDLAPDSLGGHAWGDTVVGWISFSGDNYGVKVKTPPAPSEQTFDCVISGNGLDGWIKTGDVESLNISPSNDTSNYVWKNSDGNQISTNSSITVGPFNSNGSFIYTVEFDYEGARKSKTCTVNVSPTGTPITPVLGGPALIKDFRLTPSTWKNSSNPCLIYAHLEDIKSCEILKVGGESIPFLPELGEGLVYSETIQTVFTSSYPTLDPGSYRLQCVGVDGDIETSIIRKCISAMEFQEI